MGRVRYSVLSGVKAKVAEEAELKEKEANSKSNLCLTYLQQLTLSSLNQGWS